MKMEFSCQDHVHFLRFSVLHRCIVGRVLLSLILGALYFGSFGKSTVYFLALRVLGGGSSVPVLPYTKKKMCGSLFEGSVRKFQNQPFRCEEPCFKLQFYQHVVRLGQITIHIIGKFLF